MVRATRSIIWRTEVSRTPSFLRKYFDPVICAAFWDQNAGNSPCMSTRVPPGPAIFIVRFSHVTSSYGCVAAFVKYREILNPATAFLTDESELERLRAMIFGMMRES